MMPRRRFSGREPIMKPEPQHGRPAYACTSDECRGCDVVHGAEGACPACGEPLRLVGEIVPVDVAVCRRTFLEPPTSPAGTIRIDGALCDVGAVLDVATAMRDAGMLQTWSSADAIADGQAWEPCDTVHPGPVGYEMVARAIALPLERARLLGVLLMRAVRP